MQKKNLTLQFIWKIRLRLRAEGEKHWIEGIKLQAAGDKLREESDKPFGESNKFWTKSFQLRAEGDKYWAKGVQCQATGLKFKAEANNLWAEVILEVYGNIFIEWKNWDSKKLDFTECHLETGEIFYS